jgi:Tfp pilus assembly pilus retraction ATPase PilT
MESETQSKAFLERLFSHFALNQRTIVLNQISLIMVAFFSNRLLDPPRSEGQYATRL